MGRIKAISDDEVLRVARGVFRRRGHSATTREIARAAGVSEPVLYQRFGTKDTLFFRAMHATGPDVEALLGPAEPPDEALSYLLGVAERLVKFYCDVIPLVMRVMTHPAFDPANLARLEPGGPAALQRGLAERLSRLARRGLISSRPPATMARLIVGLAHDYALGRVLAHGNARPGHRDLRDVVRLAWEGLRPRERKRSARRVATPQPR
jgi:AcrR family transcriptional regulator